MDAECNKCWWVHPSGSIRFFAHAGGRDTGRGADSLDHSLLLTELTELDISGESITAWACQVGPTALQKVTAWA